MKDYKKVDELMQKYVEATNGDVEKDFAKLDFDRYVQHSAPAAKRKMSVYIWASVAMVFIVVLTLSICLPLTLGQKSPDEPNIYYLEIEAVESVEVESFTEVLTKLEKKVFLPQLDRIEELIWWHNVNDLSVGTSFNLFIFDENINEISGYILYENIELSSLLEFKTLSLISNWNDNNVKYEVQEDTHNMCWVYMLTFNANGFNHFYTITTASEMAIGDLMDWVF